MDSCPKPLGLPPPVLRSPDRGLVIQAGVYRCWLSIWPARHYSQSPSSIKTPCGPAVVTTLEAAWRGHVCHIPFVVAADGGLLDGDGPATFGRGCVALEADSDLPY